MKEQNRKRSKVALAVVWVLVVLLLMGAIAVILRCSRENPYGPQMPVYIGFDVEEIVF